MNTDAELLNTIYQNSQMAADSYSLLIEMSDNQEFKEYLSKQINEYIKMNDSALELLTVNGFDEKKPGSLKEIASHLMIDLKTLTDKSVSNMAKTIAELSNKSVLDITEKISQNEKTAEEDIIRLLKSYKKFEEKNIDHLKKFI